ncbi:PAS domain-containing protein [Paracoccus sp. p3-h83]|uniref:PAS domain-containing protein n=1 Tax=Paracoccus sp. p3-h83 TaxID=3342805 RepID=UPI0035B81553
MGQDFHGGGEQNGGTVGQPPPGDPRILPLADFDRRIAHRTITELRSYWQGLLRGRAVPERAQIDPRAIERTLEYAFILERVAAGHARFRIAGMHLNDLMGMEVRGMPLASFFTPDARSRLQALLEQVFSGPEIVELRLEAEPGFGRPALPARMLLMPLRSDLGDVTRALGCLIAEGPPGRAPRRFGIATAQAFAVIPGAPTGPRPDLPKAAPPQAPPQAEAPPAALRPAPRGPGPDTPEGRRARFHIVT